ncbi:hypothetical protein BBK14_01695 [Parafrankia soli]|uniref:Transposase IS4 N-terminal domain-containing protein n=1 Tax=Parafrankia soli TaxID=2599596 RepID=A0A1S1RIF9_9ACTN|nr:hypothetical protein BBK14_01695 [Parafrankia soli]
MPARLVVYFTLAMCLFFDDDYEEVLRRLVSSTLWRGNRDAGWQVATSGAASQARRPLGPEPLAELFRSVARPLAVAATRGAWLEGRRLTAVDGFSPSAG